jgi:hypothetical protein
VRTPDIEVLSVLSKAPNSWVVRLPNRRYPGVVLQGDSLKALYDLAEELRELSPTKTEAHEVADELCDALRSHIITYQTSLDEHGIELPYPERVT